MQIKLILAQNYLKIALIGFVTRVTWQMPLVEQELFTLPEHMNSHLVFSEVCITRSLVFSLVFCKSLFILLSFSFWPYCLSFFDLWLLITPLVSCYMSFWPLCCLSFFDLWILITPLVSSNSSPVDCRRTHVLFTLFLFTYVKWYPTHIVLWFWFVWLRFMYPMLPASLDGPFFMAPSVFSNVYFPPISTKWTITSHLNSLNSCDICKGIW